MTKNDAGVSEVQQKVAETDAKGYIGETPDVTPNENYTFAGRAAGKPVPETDADLAKQVRDAAKQ